MVPLRAQEPTGTIRGRVVDDASKEPLASVTVTFGSHRAVTQADGRYILPGVSAGTDTVHARMLGYAPVAQSVTVVSGQVVVVDLSMTARAIGLSEIVVVGYGTQRAGDITGAVQQLSVEDFNPGRVVSPEMLIQSKVAGVQVVDNNEPGGGLSIRIRGSTSSQSSNEPLYVVDGMPLGLANGVGGGNSAGRDALNFLNPNDIESITVLKDASSAAIYGTSAANGVVLITTKSGAAAGGHRGSQVEYTASASASSVTKVPAVLSAAQFRAAMNNPALVSDTVRRNSIGAANTNWFDLVDRTGYGQEHNISVTNAGENTFYRLSAGYLNQQGILRGSSTERISLGINYNQRLFSDALGLKANLKGTRTNDQFQAGDVIGNAVGMAPTQPVYDPTNSTGYWDWNTTGASASNPVASLNRSSDHGITWRSVGNLQADYRLPFLEGLKANVNLGYDVTQTNRATFIPNDLAAQLRQGHGRLTLSNSAQMNNLLEAYLNYAAPLNVVPGNIDVTGGYSYAQTHSEYPFFQETQLNSNLLGENGVPTAGTVQNSKFVNDTKLISFFGRLNYNLNDRYLVAFSVRRDGSSKFGASNAWGTFPAASVAWRISQEEFMRSFSALSDLKLRASWARTGNQAIGDYLQYATYTYSDAQTQYQFGNNFITTIRPSSVDPNIKWEATSSYNLGLDFGFLSQRFTGSIDWYTKKTTDLIFNIIPAGGTNFSNRVITNVGSLRNKGIELTVNGAVIQGRGTDLNWNATFSASHNTNELLTIDQSIPSIATGGVSGGVGTTAQILTPGSPINSFFVCQQAFANGKPLEGKYVSLGDSVVSGCDKKSLRPYHDPAPKWIFGHTSSISFRNFDLSFTLRAYLGNYVYNNVASQGAYQSLTGGGSPSNMSASVLRTGFVVPQYLSDLYVEDGSFLRMDNITLGYAFNLYGQHMRIYATVQNAFTITGYSGVDPTAGVNGLDNNIYPRSRTVTGGLSVRF
jgi:iron complex outermembrane receptor protein